MASGIKCKLEIYESLEEYQGLSFKNVEVTAAKYNSTDDIAMIDFLENHHHHLKKETHQCVLIETKKHFIRHT